MKTLTVPQSRFNGVLNDYDCTVPDILAAEPEGLIDPDLPTSRLRGTRIYPHENGTRILGWQQNISVIKGRSVQLPTIIDLDLDRQGRVSRIQLDPSFAGSKGPLCRHNLLQPDLEELFMGCDFVAEVKRLAKPNNMRCFHLSEVLLGSWSLYRGYLDGHISSDFPWEEETMECYREGNDFIICDLHNIGGGGRAESFLVFRDLFVKAQWEGDMVQSLKGIETDFLLNGESCLSMVLDVELPQRDFSSLYSFLVKVSRIIREYLHGQDIRYFMHSAFSPASLIGLILQGAGVHLLKDIPGGFLKILDYLQRPNGVPVCLGGEIPSEVQ